MPVISKYFILLSFIFCCGISLSAQPEVPDEYSFDSEGDYRIHKHRAEECMDWLLRKPLHKKPELRAQLTAYCMVWLSGAPNDKVYLFSELLPAAEANPELMFIYAMAMHRIAQKHPEYTDLQLQAASLKKVAKTAAKSKGLVKNEALEELLQLSKSDALFSWVESRMKAAN